MKEAVALFFTLQTQWIWVGAGLAGCYRMGLDYSKIGPVADMLRIETPVSDQTFEDLRTMEGEALTVWSRKSRG